MKKVKYYAGWTIYEANAKEVEEGASQYNVFLPDESPQELCTPEFKCDSIRECIANIQSYDTDELEAEGPVESDFAAGEYLAHLEYMEGYDQWAEQSELM